MAEHLTLKWGTLKAGQVESPEAQAALQAYWDAGPVSWGAMMQRDTPEQRAALCALIDAVDGPIQNDWTGALMTPAEAKAYVMEYGGDQLT